MRRSPLITMGLLANRALAGFGLRLCREPVPADRRRNALIKNCEISTVVDIGANLGQYGDMLRRQGYQGRIMSFEPIPQVFEQLKRRIVGDDNWSVSPRAVTNLPGPVILRISENLVSSSLLEIADLHVEAAPASRIVKEVSVETTSLDEIVVSSAHGNILVKIDTQGAERAVLASGNKSLESVSLVELELSLAELYHGQALARELDDILVRRGFSLVSLQEGFFNEQTGELLQVDAIYRQSALN